MSIQAERDLAINELKRRGNPPYRPEAYYKTPQTEPEKTNEQ